MYYYLQECKTIVELAFLYHNLLKRYKVSKFQRPTGQNRKNRKRNFHPFQCPSTSVYFAICLFVGISLCLIIWFFVCLCVSVCLYTCLFVLPLSKGAAKTTCSYVVVVGQFLTVRFQVADMSDICAFRRPILRIFWPIMNWIHCKISGSRLKRLHEALNFSFSDFLSTNNVA